MRESEITTGVVQSIVPSSIVYAVIPHSPVPATRSNLSDHATFLAT